MAEIVPPKKPNPKNIEEIKLLINKNGLEPGSESYNRKLMDDGIQNIKSRKLFNEQLENGLDVQDMECGWFSNFIRDNLGGTFDSENMVVYWEINDRKIIFDPNSGKVTSESN